MINLEHFQKMIADAPTHQDTKVYWQIDIDEDGVKTLTTSKRKES
jgi:hypothetical protein